MEKSFPLLFRNIEEQETKNGKIKLDNIYNENCLETMKRMPDNFIDMTVTSPPVMTICESMVVIHLVSLN